jgi:hypothetical protein
MPILTKMGLIDHDCIKIATNQHLLQPIWYAGGTIFQPLRTKIFQIN